MDYGAWEGLTYAQIYARDAEYRSRWEAEPADLACPDGESGQDVARRVRAFLADLAGGESGTVLVVAHSTTNRILLCLALGVPVRDFRRRFQQEPANLTVLRFPGPARDGAEALLVNDVGHLRGLRGPTWAED
jgi:broad specificity phosphatase PhoE